MYRNGIINSCRDVSRGRSQSSVSGSASNVFFRDEGLFSLGPLFPRRAGSCSPALTGSLLFSNFFLPSSLGPQSRFGGNLLGI